MYIFLLVKTLFVILKHTSFDFLYNLDASTLSQEDILGVTYDLFSVRVCFKITISVEKKINKSNRITSCDMIATRLYTNKVNIQVKI